MNRTILHCDCNGFYASVECVLKPSLRDVPMAVAGNPENRHGIILAKNELAKKYKVQTAETIWQAKKKCPDLVLVPPHRAEYEKYSKLANGIYRDFTDLIEPFGIDESWLDVTGVTHLFGNGEEIADQIRKRVREELGITISVGVSFNKIYAKLGSDYRKPDATTVISLDNYKDIVFPLPVGALLYVGKNAVATLKQHHIKTIGDLANSDESLIRKSLGKTGEMIWKYANGLDDSPVKPLTEGREIKSVGNGMTFRRNLVGLDEITLGVSTLSDEVASRMRQYGVKANTISVAIKDPDFKTISRQKSLETPTHLAKEISKTAMELIKSSWNINKPIRLITITGMNLVNENYVNEQISIFGIADAAEKEKQERLESAMDKIRGKFGKSAISIAGVLKNDLGIKE